MHRALARAVLYAVLPQMADESFDPKAEPYAYTRSQADLIDRAVRLAAEGLQVRCASRAWYGIWA